MCLSVEVLYVYLFGLIFLCSPASRGTHPATRTAPCILLEESWVLEGQHAVEDLELFMGSDGQMEGSPLE